MPLDFPNSPTTGQTWNATNGAVYAWDGSKWTLPPASGGPFLPIAGGTVSGDTTFNTNIDANTGIFGGVAYPGQRAGGAARTWVGLSDNGYMTYYDTESLVSFIAPPAYALGLVSSIRSSDRPTGSPANIAIATYATSDSTASGAGGTWAYYGSIRRVAGAPGAAIGMELSMGALGACAECNPYLTGASGSAFGLWLSSGSEAYEAGETVFPASSAITVVSNGSTWAKGLVFGYNALLPGTNGTMKAIQLPIKGEIQWTFDPTGARSSFIRCDATAANPGIVFESNSFNVVDSGETTNLLQVTPSNITAAVPVAMNSTVTAGGKVTASAGISFPAAATSATDLSHHIDLSGTNSFGINEYNGLINFNTPAGTYYVFNVGGAASAFISSNTVQAAGAFAFAGNGPSWTTGTTAPSATAPVGSLYSRVGGAVGATLYVSRGAGTWNAVAGV